MNEETPGSAAQNESIRPSNSAVNKERPGSASSEVRHQQETRPCSAETKGRATPQAEEHTSAVAAYEVRAAANNWDVCGYGHAMAMGSYDCNNSMQYGGREGAQL